MGWAVWVRLLGPVPSPRMRRIATSRPRASAKEAPVEYKCKSLAAVSSDKPFNASRAMHEMIEIVFILAFRIITPGDRCSCYQGRPQNKRPQSTPFLARLGRGLPCYAVRRRMAQNGTREYARRYACDQSACWPIGLAAGNSHGRWPHGRAVPLPRSTKLCTAPCAIGFQPAGMGKTLLLRLAIYRFRTASSVRPGDCRHACAFTHPLGTDG